ncbi:hypothetical protein TKK_0000015 [Trichogramma kaykai]|uniref:poly(A)-specific ribonuclease n=1 Tax=Trichogramma kaykai TaxID=54128 RepID=A0ABD2VUY6_9HYME
MLPPGLQTNTEVWDANLESAIEDMRNALEITSFIAFDVEFPGTLLKKRQFLFNHPQEAEWDYINNTLKHTQPIQFGFAFYGLNNEGQAQHINTWQVNSRFDEKKKSQIQRASNF